MKKCVSCGKVYDENEIQCQYGHERKIYNLIIT